MLKVEALDDLPSKGRERVIVNQTRSEALIEEALVDLPSEGRERTIVSQTRPGERR